MTDLEDRVREIERVLDGTPRAPALAKRVAQLESQILELESEVKHLQQTNDDLRVDIFTLETHMEDCVTQADLMAHPGYLEDLKASN